MADPLSADRQLEAARMFGNTVREYPGWRTRGLERARTKGWAPQGIVIHHTAGNLGSRSPEAYIRDILVGDPSVPDKCSVAIDPDGVVWMVAAGRANHMLYYSQSARDMAIAATWPTTGSTNARGSLQNGNSWTYGVEIIAAGSPNPAQRLAAVRWAAGLAKLHGWSGGEVFGHGEAAYDRDFSDPGLDMGAFRRDVAALLGAARPAPARPQDTPAPPAPPTDEASRPWWGNRPEPQEPAYLKISNLRRAMDHDAPSQGQELYWYADQVWALQRLLIDTGWLRRDKLVPGHYGTYTIGNAANQDDGGVKGFQAKRGWSTPDGWVGRRELGWLMDTTGRRYNVED